MPSASSSSRCIQYDVIPDAAGRGSHLVVLGYRYRLLDRQEREILAFHWHPTGVSPVIRPHLHLSGRLPPLDLGSGAPPAVLGGMHIPTGSVALADVVWLLISEFGVEPRRDDWERVIETHRDPFAGA